MFERSEFADRALPTEHRKETAAGGLRRRPAHALPHPHAALENQQKITFHRFIEKHNQLLFKDHYHV
ncbi:MAG TPA: hypothetical protein PK347_12055 [Burkholderiaceae bacterium]|nr:hypothetical protein [Burkholderiaceae bacterium]